MTVPTTRRTFFSFHYSNDSTRAAVVRNSGLIRSNANVLAVSRTGASSQDFSDKAEWERIKRSSDAAIKTWIQKQLLGTSVTVVLIGAETANRPWVRYEIEQSALRGNGIVGVRIHGIKNLQGATSNLGANPFDSVTDPKNPTRTLTQSGVKVYSWTLDDGYNNLPTWIHEAAKHAGR